ncbi:MAG TPA: prepilin-type N-terminal cleavage/methylation domain-containing protein [Longimicrobiaceae bacterium]
MTTESPPRRGDGGFTLIEVLFAMVILAVGLLAMEALGISATRLVHRSERQSAFAVAASDTLERIMGRIRAAPNVTTVRDTSFSYLTGDNAASRDTVRVRVTGFNTSIRTVSVTVVPSPGASGFRRSDSLRVTGNVFRQN